MASKSIFNRGGSHLVIRASLQSTHETVSLPGKCKKAVARSHPIVPITLVV